MNNLYIVGRLTKEPEVRTTTSGAKIVNITIAVNRDYKNVEGTYDTDFIPVKAFGITSNYISEYVHKGDLIGIRGKIQTGLYEKDGQKVYTMDVVADKVAYLGGVKTKEDKPTEKKEQTDPFAEMGERVEQDLLD